MRKKRKVRYPKERKKKVNHTQWMAFDRVIEKWKIVPEAYYMFKFDDHWYACVKDTNFYDSFNIDGDYYRPVYKMPFYEGNNGDIVYGWIAVIRKDNMGLVESKFGFMMHPSQKAAMDLSHAISFRRDISFENYKKNLWKDK